VFCSQVTFLYGVHLDGNDAVFTAMERCGESLSQVNTHTHAKTNLPITFNVPLFT